MVKEEDKENREKTDEEYKKEEEMQTWQVQKTRYSKKASVLYSKS